MLKKLDCILLYITDTHRSSEFYRQLGFNILKENDFSQAQLHNFTIRFQDKNKAIFQNDTLIEPKGVGMFIYIQVEQIDQYFQIIKAKGLKPSSKPRSWPWGKREFVIRDPDGYKLVFYEETNNQR